MQTGEHLCTVIRKQIKLDYLLHIPSSYNQKETYPLILFLHGSAQRGDNITLVKQVGLPKVVEDNPGFPCIVVSPQCPITDTWTSHVDALKALIAEISTRFRVDATRVYLTGFSLGGRGVWYLAAQAPELFAAIVPICGRGFPELAKRLIDVPVWAFHGENDSVVTLRESETMVSMINDAGGNATLTVYPNTGHDAWTQAYSDSELYKWLLDKRRHRTPD